MRRHILSALCLTGFAVSATELELDRGHRFTWSSTTGATYQLQHAPDPGGPWQNLGAVVAGDGGERSAFHQVPAAATVFRLEAEVPVAPPVAALPIDGGFELGSGGAFDHWNTGASSPPTRWDGDAHSGTHSLRSQLANTGAAAEEGLAWQLLGAEGGVVNAGATYDFSFRAKQISSGVSYVQQYEVQWLNGSGGVVGSTGLQAFAGGAGTWDEVSVPGLVSPAGTADARVTFRFVTGVVEGGLGEVLIDDVSLVESGGGGSPPETETVYFPIVPEDALRASWFGSDEVPYQAWVSSDLSHWLPAGPEQVGEGAELEVILPLTARREFVVVTYPGGPPLPDLTGDIVPLFSEATTLAPALQYATTEALVTRVGDRARDRHAREAVFNAYDHYLTRYWEERTLDLTIIDEVAMGGTGVTFDYTTQAPLSAPEFRAFFRGITTVAEYHANLSAPLVGPNRYRVTLNMQQPENRPLAIGDRIEIEISQFLASPMHGRSNYYGTAILYVVGEGIVPWQGVGPLLDSFPLPESAWLGGQTTLPYQYSDEPEHRFKQTAGNIAPESIQEFMLGRRLHHTDFGDGTHSEPGNPVFTDHLGKLGPQFIARSCVACHTNNGRALPPAIGTPMLQSVVRVGQDAEGRPHPTLGSVLQPQVISGSAEGGATIASYTLIPGTYGDGSPYELRKPVYAFTGVSPSFHSTRLAPPLVGLGLLEAVDEATVLAAADPTDADSDGISGKARKVVDPVTGEVRLGRFAARGGQAMLKHQVASALNTDMGVTTSIHPTLDDGSTPGAPEVSDTELAQMTLYVATLGVSARRDLDDPDALAGEALFDSMGCAKCHTPTLTTSAYHPLAELRDQTIHPYTDLLLHDMGPGLADNMGEDGVTGSEWRTAPLWSIGLTSGVSGGEAYLHDGRARSLAEAILWHGGEGESAKEAFRTAPASDRAKLIKFLESL